jgi:serine/threonine protein kinase
MPLTVGETVGPYRIVEQLGQGGMATVFKAYHAALDRYVAIKVLHPAFMADAGFLARLQREARVVARLEHPNIVPVYDYAEHHGAPFLVMKFIPGETLKARLARSPLSAADVLRCVEAVGAALEFAHGQAVLHRDIKPSNIMLAADGAIFLTDFGLARMAQAGESTLSADTLLGTPSYMSPEQARGDKELDAGTDIYSFGVVVYELMVGRVPFSADTPYAVIHDHIFTPLPSPRSINPAVPDGVEKVLLKALAKDRASRYGTVAQMVADLRRGLGSPVLAVANPGQSFPFAVAPTVAAAPDADTPSSAPATSSGTQPTMSGPLPVVAALPAAAPVVSVPVAGTETARKSPSRLQWWQLALGLVLLGGCCLLAFGVLARVRRQSTAGTETAVAALPATAVSAPTSATISVTPAATALPTPASSAAEQHLLAAQRAFVAGHTDAGLAQLDQAVAVNPSDSAVLLRAGDLALAQKLAVEALSRYYVPGVNLEFSSPDAQSGGLRSHAALAFYVAAADQASGPFLDGQVTNYPDAGVPLVAQQRHKVFFAAGQGVLAQLSAVGKNGAQGALASLVLGDYYLARIQLVEAARQYTPVSDMRLANGVVPDWVIREARCDLEAIKTEHANAKVEASCVDLLSLLTGK